MKQEFVTLPREVVERALEALSLALSDVDWRKDSPTQPVIHKAYNATCAELEQPDHSEQNLNMIPAGWKLVPDEPTAEMQAGYLKAMSAPWVERYRDMLASAPHPPTVKHSLTVEQPQVEQPAMTPIAQRKLDDLVASGYTISGYSVYHERKHQHGFVTGAGLVGWWKPEGVEYPQPHGEPSTVAFCHVGDVVVCDNDSLLRQLGVKRSDKLYLHPQDLNCKSKQALLATLWGYVKEQPKREPLTDMQKMMCWSRATHDADVWHKTDHQCLMDYGAEIEAAHNIK